MKDIGRAERFLSFDAMKGLTEATYDRSDRRLRQEWIELSEEGAAGLSAALAAIKVGSRVLLTFYNES